MDIEIFLTRRSIREFQKKDVPKEILSKILDCGLSAPSAKNSNPWYFLVLQRKNKDEVAVWMREGIEKLVTSPIDPSTGKANPRWDDSTLCSADIIENSPVLILVFNRSPFIGGRRTLSKYISEKVAFTYSDEIVGIGAAIENILLSAHALGLGGVCIADVYPAEDQIVKKYEISYDLLIGIAIGYPSSLPRKRKLRKELVRFV